MCEDCKARLQLARDALMRKRFSEAAGHALKGAAEMAGLKRKTGQSELRKAATKRVKQDAK